MRNSSLNVVAVDWLEVLGIGADQSCHKPHGDGKCLHHVGLELDKGEMCV